eukprot:21544-Heterococcus_DN1.PRE.1
MIRACDCFVHQALKSYEPELSGYGQRTVLNVSAHSEACIAAACAEAGPCAVRASRVGVRHACVVLAIVCARHISTTVLSCGTPVRRYRPGALVTDPTIQDDISALIKKGKLPARKKATSVNNY